MGEWRTELYLTVDKQGRIVIPKGTREKLGITPGSKLKFVATSDGEEVMTLRKCT